MLRQIGHSGHVGLPGIPSLDFLELKIVRSTSSILRCFLLIWGKFKLTVLFSRALDGLHQFLLFSEDAVERYLDGIRYWLLLVGIIDGMYVSVDED